MPTKSKQTLLPADPDDLVCDTCPERFPYKGDTYRTFEAARVKGWHIYQHIVATYTRAGDPAGVVRNIDTRILCPQCVGTPRSQLPAAPTVLEGQADILEALAVTAEEEKKPPEKGTN